MTSLEPPSVQLADVLARTSSCWRQRFSDFSGTFNLERSRSLFAVLCLLNV